MLNMPTTSCLHCLGKGPLQGHPMSRLHSPSRTGCRVCSAGMVLGNAISGISVGLSTVVEELSSGGSSCGAARVLDL